MKSFTDILQGIDPEAVGRLLAFDSRNPLLFNTGLFLVLFVGFLLLYTAIRRWKNVKLIFVILFSLYFYYKSSAEYCFILLGVCVSDFLLGQAIGKVMQRSRAGAKWLIALNIVINVGMLVYFKYFNLLYETFANITNTNFDALDIILPAGISFFTFRSISYVVDIYRGELKPSGNFLEYTFYLTFFPPLLAGPVVRAKDMLPQVAANTPADRAMVGEGIFLIVAGIIKKVVIADYISGGFVNRIFENPGLYSGFENMMGAVGFTLQIYCDFSGYSDMAIGIALLLGYRLGENFNAPFKAANPTEFWHRWHISLSTWLRDYVYIPMGGNRKGRLRTNINQMTTMLIGGLWHGASWLYLIWGAYQGILLVGHKTARSIYRLPERVASMKPVKAVNITFTFILTVIGFVIFRFAIESPHIDEASAGILTMGKQIFTDFRPQAIPAFIEAYPLIVLAILAGILLHYTPARHVDRLRDYATTAPAILLMAVLVLTLLIAIQTRQADLVPFVYLQY